MAVYGADYFLSPPRLFILNHLPAQPMWQLLPCPVGPAEFCRPADALAALVKAQDSCYNYPDTIRAFLQHSGQEQSLLEAESAYRFHSTAKNQAAWAQSLLDYAVYLSEQASPLQQATAGKNRLITGSGPSARPSSPLHWPRRRS